MLHARSWWLAVVMVLAAPAVDAAPPASGKAAAKAPAKKKKAAADKGVSTKGTDARPSTPSATPTEAAGVAEPGTRRGMSRIEFDDRLIQGQTNKANAIYLFERRESALRSLLKKRSDFHEEIDETLE